VAAWVGSANAGDELVHAGLRLHLDALGVDPVVPGRAGLVTAALTRRVEGLVLGGGGLLQDETSAANLPFHLAPVLVARVPAVGVGLGAGPLTTRSGRALVRTALQRLHAVSVRDAPSADVLMSLGAPRPIVTADLALRLQPPVVDVDDVVIAALRPWSGRRHRLPVALRRRGAAAVDADHARRAAVALDAVAERTGLGVRLVALEPPKDGPLLRAVADRMRAPATVVEPAPLEVPAVLARGRVLVAMRYHAGIAAALGRRPAVLLGYSPKVAALAADLDARALPWDLADPALLAAAVADALGRSDDDLAGRLDALQRREAGNREVLERLLS
jgi:polysaccharide pyruvyl transferase WcaK-like protein